MVDVGLLYLAALIIGLGTIGLQLFMSGDSDADADADAGGEADFEADADADAHVDVHGGHGPAHGDGGFLPIFLSLRFWTFAFLAFGLSGSLLHYLDLSSPAITPFVALAFGLFSGLLSSLTFRALQKTEANSAATASDVVGQVGKVLLPVAKGARGKVRIELKGQTVDLLATTDEEQLEQGQLVMIEEVRDTTAHVARVPAELLPPKGD